ncbi:MAG: urease accessory protein UreD [Devosia sp.]|nr:urease accessory protein UreD [Devosia sp.]
MKHATISSEQCQLDLSFVVRNGQTLLDRRMFSYPYVLMRTFREPSGAVHSDEQTRLMAIVQNSSGPVHDRDDLAINLVLNAAANVRIAWQGATAIHRARSGNLSRERLSISLGEGAHLGYLPEARIYFPDAAHQQATDIELSTGSTMLFADSFTVHDPENRSRLLSELDNTLTIRRAGETVLLDRQHLRSPAFNPAFRAFGTLLFIGLDEPELPAIPDLYAAKSQLPNALGWSIRLAAPDLRPIRAAVRTVTSP